MYRRTTFSAALVALVGVSHLSADTIMPTPTHHYPFDVDASDVTGTNDGTFMNGASILPDLERGNVLNLDGINDMVWLENSNVPDGSMNASVFTIAAWVKMPEDPSGSHQGGIYGEFGEGTMCKNFFSVKQPGGRIWIDQFPPKSGNLKTSTSVSDGTWHHVAYVQNERGKPGQQMYVDGVLDGVGNSPEKYRGTAPYLWAIGARLGAKPSLPAHTKGRIDDLRFYNAALSADQIGVLATPDPPGEEASRTQQPTVTRRNQVRGVWQRWKRKPSIFTRFPDRTSPRRRQ